MRIKLGIKAWSTLSAILFSLVVISGCNSDENPPSSNPPANAAPSANKPSEPPKPKMEPATPPPPTTPDQSKDMGKEPPKP